MKKETKLLLENLTGVHETMFIPLYARSLERYKKNPSFHDETAIKIVDSIDFNFKKYGKFKLTMWGCAARTTILDRETRAYIKKHPNCTIINMACGLDDRFSRVDNGSIIWYNIDFENIMEIRKELLPENERVFDITSSVLDFTWFNEIKDKNNVLIIAEGILMYLEDFEVKDLFENVAKHFESCTLLCEFMAKWFADKQKLYYGINPLKARLNIAKKKDLFIMTADFKWGVKKTEDFLQLCPMYKMTDEFNFSSEMKKYSPLFISLFSFYVQPRNNRIGRFEKIPLK